MKKEFNKILLDKHAHVLKDILEIRKKLHQYIENDDCENFSNLIQSSAVNINSCLDFDNHTLLHNSVYFKKYDIYGYLISIGAKLSEVEKTDDLLFYLDKKEQECFKNAILTYLKRYEDALAAHLYSLTRIRRLEQGSDIKKLYLKLSKNEYIRPILQVIEHANPKLDILVDMTSIDITYLYPPSGRDMGLCIFRESKIYIGANSSEDEMLGTIAHEFTHQACEVLFKNETAPYGSVNNLIQKENFKKIKTQLKNNISSGQGIDDIIRRACKDSSSEERHDSELIVRVPHMLAKYGLEIGIKKLEVEAPLLWSFYKQDFLPLCQKFIKNKQEASKFHYEGPYEFALNRLEYMRDKKNNKHNLSSLIKPIVFGLVSGATTYGICKSSQTNKATTTVSIAVGGVMASMTYLWDYCSKHKNNKTDKHDKTITNFLPSIISSDNRFQNK